jgi:TolA-binding protein
VADAEKAFLEVVDTYGRSDQADMARLYLARIALGRGEIDDARTALVDLSERHGDDLIGRLATLDLIDVRVASGQGVEVAADLEAVIAGQSRSLPKDAALYRLGELFVGEGDPERARPYFERLLEEFPESPYLNNARLKLAELGS